jgi:hypothetical protein
MPIDFELLARVVGAHCCGGDRRGGRNTEGHEASDSA